MRIRLTWRRNLLFTLPALSFPGLWLAVTAGCASPGVRSSLLKECDAVRLDKAALERKAAQQEETIAQLRQQVANLTNLGPDRPADLFAPVKLEIASLSGGADYDGRPGDDGVTVYLRPRDADGDVVKVPGRITIQLIDNSNLTSPRVLGVYVFDDAQKLRGLWHDRFATKHYTLKCPLAPVAGLHARRITVSVEFVDYLTGKTLTAVKEVPFSQPPA